MRVDGLGVVTFGFASFVAQAGVFQVAQACLSTQPPVLLDHILQRLDQDVGQKSRARYEQEGKPERRVAENLVE